MYDNFFFPYEKAKLWTGNLILLSLSHFLLHASLYLMLPVLPLWVVRMGYGTYAEAGGAVMAFAAGMFLPGMFNAYLIDTFRRKYVCLLSMLLVLVAGWLYPYAGSLVAVVGLRLLQGAFFGIAMMTTGSTLVIDVTASHRRTDANVAFSWTGRVGALAGLVAGVSIYPYWDFTYVVYASTALAGVACLLVLMVNVPFRAPLQPPLLSLDRFLLPRAGVPALNMWPVAFIFGVVIAHIYNELFYLCMAIGFGMAWILSRRMLSHTTGRQEMELGQAALVGGLLLVTFSHSLTSSYIAAILMGLGTGLSASRSFTEIISLPMHCERGTGNNTYQLVWELGVLAGVGFENVCAGWHPSWTYGLCMGLSIAALAGYELFTHDWFHRQMEDKSSI